MNKTVFAAVLAASSAIMAVSDVSAKIVVTNAGPEYCYSPYTKYKDMSGITWAGGNKFYVIRNDNHLSVMTVSLDGNGNLTSLPSMTEGIPLQGADDPEGIAYDPGSGMVWISDERSSNPSGGPTILEYDPETGEPTGRSVPIPPIFKKAYKNLSLESLSMSCDGLTMWTANEENLSCDGGPSKEICYNKEYEARCPVVRLTKFTRPNLQGPWSLAGMWPYECWPADNFKPFNSGVSDLIVLPDDSLVVLERNVSATLYTVGKMCLYRPNLANATDVQNYASLSNRASYTLVDMFGSSLQHNSYGLDVEYNFDGQGHNRVNVRCYEGACLGPRNADGSINLMMVSDGGLSYSVGMLGATAYMQPYVRAFKLTGLDVHTLKVNKQSAVGRSSVVERNYPNNAQVEVNLVGEEFEPTVYTNRGDLVLSPSWSLSKHNKSGSGTKAKFNITKDDVLTWSASASIAQTPIYAHDTFEEYADGTTASSMKNWSGEGVVALGTPPQSKWILKRDSHNRVLDAEDEVVRNLSSMQMTNNKNHRMDMLVQVRRSMYGLVEPTGNARLSIQVDANGCLSLWHLGCNNGQTSRRWSMLGPYTYSNGTWIKLSIVQYYTSSGAFAYVAVNDSVCNVMGGYGTANDTPRLRTGYGSGAWFPLPSTSAPQSLTVVGTKIDDFVVAMPDFVDMPAAHNIVVSPLSSAGGDSPRMTFSVATATPAAAAPAAAKPRSASPSAADSSAEPADAVSAPAITGFGLTADNCPRIRFTGFAEGAVYRVVRSASLDFKGDDVESLDGDVTGNENGVAVWEGKSACDPSAGAKFYRIEVVAE